MDKVFSTRLDEDLIKKINQIVKEKSICKKRLIEKVLKLYLKDAGSDFILYILEKSFGAWKRAETADETWKHGRRTFNRAFSRYALKDSNESIYRQ